MSFIPIVLIIDYSNNHYLPSDCIHKLVPVVLTPHVSVLVQSYFILRSHESDIFLFIQGFAYSVTLVFGIYYMYAYPMG